MNCAEGLIVGVVHISSLASADACAVHCKINSWSSDIFNHYWERETKPKWIHYVIKKKKKGKTQTPNISRILLFT